MQGQSSLQVKDPYTGSILIPHACRLILQTHRSVQCTPPKNNQKLIDGSNKKTTKKILCKKIFLNRAFSILKLPAREVTIFPEKNLN